MPLLAMPLMATLATANAAPPPGWTHVKDASGCAFYASPPDDKGLSITRAECFWEDVDPDRFAEALSRWGDQSQIFSTIARSEVLSETDGVARVHHLHTVPMMSPREGVLRMWSAPTGDGGQRFAWSVDPQQPPIAPGSMPIPQDDGHWSVWPADVGSVVVTELYYDPGGATPTWLLRFFQSTALVSVVDEMHRWASRPPPADPAQEPPPAAALAGSPGPPDETTPVPTTPPAQPATQPGPQTQDPSQRSH